MKVSECQIRMYKMGTGDCFLLKFKSKNKSEEPVSMMIDCGALYGSKANLSKYISHLLNDINGKLNYLVVTHEHNDHVLGFQQCEHMFKDKVKVNELWLPWTENESDPKVKKWKIEYGKQKKTLSSLTQKLESASNSSLFANIYGNSKSSFKRILERQKFVKNLSLFMSLNDDFEADPNTYIGGLKGMNVVKNKEVTDYDKIKYFSAGDVIEKFDDMENIRIYILAPSHLWKDAKKEHGKDGETYKHNKELEEIKGLSSLSYNIENSEDLTAVPFSQEFLELPDEKLHSFYYDDKSVWRRIEYDWLFASANLALRLTRGINNLSLVLGIEFKDSGKVLLFPGDAEIGSWQSWHKIKWDIKKDGKKNIKTKDLLQKTVFYKVAHHMSHNGTAKSEGLDYMTHPDLIAFGTLDYDVISPGWKNTMPNNRLMTDLIERTNGRLIVMNPKGIFVDNNKSQPLEQETKLRREQMSKKEKKQFEDNYKSTKLYEQIIIHSD